MKNARVKAAGFIPPGRIDRAMICNLIAVVVSISVAEAQIVKTGKMIRLEPVASGLTAPVELTHAGDGSGRLFIVDQAGQIRIVKDGVLLVTPYLDLSTEIVAIDPGFDERGLLGLAFHPQFASQAGNFNRGRFFVRYSIPRVGSSAEPCFGTPRGCHSEVLAEFFAKPDPQGDPQFPDPSSDEANPSGSIFFQIAEPQFNHNSGTVAFGPDGFLYFSLGDGGGAHDGLADEPPSHGEFGNGQNINTALGSLLRIDVDTPCVPLPYAIPPDNPFVGVEGVDEIYAYGLRNPFKFSFDDGPGGDGRLFLADVGQNLFEEIDIIVKGGNYGWVIREGAHCFDPFDPGVPLGDCLAEDLIDPIAEYNHAEGGTAIIGGFVYRGMRSPGLTGTYVFGDFSTGFTTPGGRLYFLEEPMPGEHVVREFIIGPGDEPYGKFLKGTGEDEEGEVYVMGSTALAPTGTAGVVERIVMVGDCNGDGGIDDSDVGSIFECVDGPNVPADISCDCADFDGNGFVDLRDVAGAQLGFRPSACGNGALDPGEACDDGNRTPGDGCSATCTIEPLTECMIDFDLACPNSTKECGALFSGGGGCQFANQLFCYTSGSFSYRVSPATSPLTITLDGDMNKLEVFFAGFNGGFGTMNFFDKDGAKVDSINSLGDCSISMPLKQTVTFTTPVRKVEVTAAGVNLGAGVWIDDFRINPLEN